MRQALAIAIALSTQQSPGHRHGAGTAGRPEGAHARSAVRQPFEVPAWVAGAQDELDGIARLVRAFTQTPEPGAADA